MIKRSIHSYFLVAIFSLVVILLGACENQTNGWPSKRFESAQWLQTKEVERYVFVNDLIAKKVLLGLTRSEVNALLGPPSSEPESSNYFSYVVKADSGVVHILDVKLTEREPRVVNVVLVRSD